MATNKPSTPEAYIAELADDQKNAIIKLRNTILKNLPKGFKEEMSYGMIGYVVPHQLYPNGYHCNPKLPLPFLSIAAQKNFIAFYHMGIYAQPELLNWFVNEYPKHSHAKLDMGKSCIRFKKPEHIPYELLGQLCTKITVQNWINIYEKNLKK
jgi:uncharacterized protein YdhG (YjbR/CyaY superfamily)